MTKVMVDAATRARLHNLDGLLEMCDESGQTLGFFHPRMAPPTSENAAIRSPISDEEIEKRRQQRTGRPLVEILQRLSPP